MTNPPPLTPAFRITFGILVALTLSLIWVPHYLPLTDYPEHLLAIQVLGHYHDTAFEFARNYTYDLHNLPYISVYLLGMGLVRIFSVYTVGKIILSLYVVLTPASILMLVRSIPGLSPWNAIVSIGLLFNLFYYLGSLNFLLSIFLAFFLLALLLQATQGLAETPARPRDAQNKISRPWISSAILCLLSIALLYSHIVTFVAVLFVAVVLLGHALARRRPIRYAIVSLLPSIVLTAYLLWHQRSAAPSSYEMSWLPFRDRLFDLLQPFLIYRDDVFHHIVINRLYLILLGIWVLTVAVSMLLSIHGPIRDNNISGRSAATTRSIGWIILGCFTLTAIIFPSQIPSASVGHRLSVLVMFSICAVIPGTIFQKQTWRAVLIAVTGLVLALNGYYAYEFNQEMRPFMELVQHMKPDARVLPLFANLHCAHLKTYPFLHVINYYHLEKGGTNPYLLFQNMPQMPVHYRALDELPAVGSFDPRGFNWEKHHDSYQYFLTRDPAPQILEQLQDHTREVFHSDGWDLFEPR